jgi:hypothetical protein
MKGQVHFVDFVHPVHYRPLFDQGRQFPTEPANDLEDEDEAPSRHSGPAILRGPGAQPNQTANANANC